MSAVTAAMCVDYDSQNQRGVAGSPLKHLEVFRFDFSEVLLTGSCYRSVHDCWKLQADAKVLQC